MKAHDFCGRLSRFSRTASQGAEISQAAAGLVVRKRCCSKELPALPSESSPRAFLQSNLLVALGNLIVNDLDFQGYVQTLRIVLKLLE